MNATQELFQPHCNVYRDRRAEALKSHPCLYPVYLLSKHAATPHRPPTVLRLLRYNRLQGQPRIHRVYCWEHVFVPAFYVYLL